MDITVIFNPTAGGGRAKRLRQFVRALEQGGARVRLYHTRGPGDATGYLQSLEDQGDCVVAVGGDGTTNEVLNGLAAGVALGVFEVVVAHSKCIQDFCIDGIIVNINNVHFLSDTLKSSFRTDCCQI